uniref:Beta-1,3-glucan-binding protein-like n=1 Tax=Diabrotica virgifera virgifera TaxID=50390 RepID=A0A6P7GA73_DIAVI
MKILFVVIWFAFVKAQYEVPDAVVEVYEPKGFTVSIPDEEGIKLFAFHGKINEDFDGLEAGTFARDILKPRNGSWTFRDRETRLKKGDIIYYWLYVDYNNGRNTLGYRKTDQQYEVREFSNNPNAPVNRVKPTTEPTSTAKLILFDDFSTKRDDFWTVEQRYADAPDYEFVLYVNKPEVFQIKDSNLHIRPVPSEDIFGNGFLTSEYDLGNSCTAPIGTTDCKRKYDAGFILPPIASAQLTTKNKVAFKYGKIEVRAKLPKGDWIYPEIYLTPANEKYGLKSQSGQIRIAFTPGNSDLNHVLHGGLTIGRSVAATNYFDKTIESKMSSWSDDFHTFRVDWKPNEISFSVDGTVYGNIYPPARGLASLGPTLNLNTDKWKEGTLMAPFDQEMYLTLGVGVGGFVFKESPSKPWRNGERNSFQVFNSARQQWQRTWSDDSKLEVEYVQITSLESVRDVRNREEIPEDWKRAIICPVNNKGDKHNTKKECVYFLDREQAQGLFNQFKNSVSEYQQKNGGNGEIKVLNPSNIADLANIFTKNLQKTQNPNNNFLPIVKVRYEDGPEGPENIYQIIPNKRNSADLSKTLVDLWNNITEPNNTNTFSPTPPSESTGYDESTEDDSPITTTSEKPISKPKPIPKPKPNKNNNKVCQKSKTYVEGEKQCKGKLIFSEDFSSLNTHVWNIEHIFAAAPDYEFTIYVNRPDVYSITDNYIQLAPVRTEDIFGPSVLGYDGSLDLGKDCTGRAGPPDCRMINAGGFIVPIYSSFRMNTKNKFNFKYGIVEIRAKLPAGDWLYPILYLNPSAETYGKYYASGQMRIAYIEGNTGANHILKGGVILGDSEPARNYYMMNTTKDSSWADTFHKYRLEWRPETIILSVDNRVYGRIEPPEGGFLAKASELQIGHSEGWRQGAKLAPFDKEEDLKEKL